MMTTSPYFKLRANEVITDSLHALAAKPDQQLDFACDAEEWLDKEGLGDLPVINELVTVIETLL